MPSVPFVETGTYPTRPGNHVIPWIDGEPAFRRICDAIDAARESVWVTVTFMWASFQTPEGRGSALDVLERAAGRGLDIRLLCWRPDEETAALRQNAFWGAVEHFDVLARRHPRLNVRWDRAHPGFCQHQKTWLIDAHRDTATAFVGGINLNPYSVVTPEHRGEHQNHDVCVEVAGPVVADVHHNFVQRWNEASERTRDDGRWGEQGDSTLDFPTRTPPGRGDVVVQIQRTTHAGRYRDGHPPPGASRYPIEQGERTNLAQYLVAIGAARRTIYLEHQVLDVAEVVSALDDALTRGVEVVAMLPVAADLLAQAPASPERLAVAEAHACLARHEHFTACGMAGLAADGSRTPVHVHSKLMIVDDEWATVGSCNLHGYSLFGNGELNAAFSHAPTVRALRVALFQEHLGTDTSGIDDVEALRLFRRIAHDNRARHLRNDPRWQGLAFLLDTATPARPRILDGPASAGSSGRVTTGAVVSNEQEDDFATLFEASVKARQVQQGQTVEGTIVAFAGDVALVSIGGKSEAQISNDELKDDEGDVEVSVGDRIQARVVSTKGGISLSRRGVRNAASQRELEHAFSSGMAVEGKVAGVIKGGYEVRIARERAFCPLSQIDIVRTADPAVHVGKTYAFRVTEYKDGGKSIVVSRRKQLEEEQEANAAAVREKIVPEAILPGRVVSVLDYGAFVDLGGGIQGLLHVSDMSWSRSTTPGALVAAGDQITVKVLRVDQGTGKISLGLKQLENDPWATAGAAITVGDVRSGRVTRLAEFGAFVELAPGIEGLAHASTFPPTGRRDDWKNTVPVGTTAAFEVLSVDPAQKRIGLALVEAGSSRAAGATASRDELKAGTIVVGKVERHEPFGVFVFLSPGRTALLPNAETGLDRGADLRKAFPVGSEVEVAVTEVDPGGRRIRVSKTAVAQQREQAELRDYSARTESAPKQSIGSLADKLQNALKGRQR